MTPFLSGFCDELTKVAFGEQTPPSPKPIGGGGGPPTSFTLPGGGKTFSVPIQKLESPAAPPSPTRYRPAPAYKAQPSSDPASTTAKRSSGGRNGGVRNDIVPWESGFQRWSRLSKEKSYNAGLQQGKGKTSPTNNRPNGIYQSFVRGGQIARGEMPATPPSAKVAPDATQQAVDRMKAQNKWLSAVRGYKGRHGKNQDGLLLHSKL